MYVIFSPGSVPDAVVDGECQVIAAAPVALLQPH